MMRLFRSDKKGLNLMEVILVVVIVGIAAALVAPNVRIGIENRQAKQVDETLRSIYHAIRMYTVDYGRSPADLKALEDAGYLKSTEYAYKRTSSNTDSNGYQYSISTTCSGTCTGTCAQAEQFTFTTTVIKGQCRDICVEECKRRRESCGCGDCLRWQKVCDQDTIQTTKQSIGTVQVCE